MTEERKRGPGRPPKIIDPKNREDEQELEDIETMFLGIPHNYTVKVYRLDPEWCDGYAGQFNVAAGKGLSVEEIKNRFGGRVLELVIYKPGVGGILKRRTIHIADEPRVEGRIKNRDGSLQGDNGQNNQASGGHPIEKIMGLNLPPHLHSQVAAYCLGIPEPAPKCLPENQSTQDLLMQKAVMDMMAQSQQSQMQMAQQQFDMQRQMMQTQRDFANDSKPKDPLSDVNTTIALLREINGVKDELGTSSEGLAAQVIQQTAPLIEAAMTEFFGYKKIQAQAELNRNNTIVEQRPAISPRANIGAAPQIAPATQSPVELASQMAGIYKTLSPEEQKSVMNAFIGGMDEPGIEEETLPYDQNIEDPLESGIIENEEVLTPEDKALLHANDEVETGDVSNGEHAGTVEAHDQNDRQGDTAGIAIPSH